MKYINGEFKMKYKIAVLIGRFQPCHKMHIELIKKALSLGEQVLIILGSAKSASTVKNPFTPVMREEMIRGCFNEEDNTRLRFAGVRDYHYNENTWITEVQNTVNNLQEEFIPQGDMDAVEHSILLGKVSVCLVGHEKDGTSYYLKKFPQWTYEPFYRSYKEYIKMDSSSIRDNYLDRESEEYNYMDNLPP
jgi:bifunctional NMN adenylyltransferase/nudix hydrolase